MSTGESSRCWIGIIFLGFTGERAHTMGSAIVSRLFLDQDWAEWMGMGSARFLCIRYLLPSGRLCRNNTRGYPPELHVLMIWPPFD